MATSKNGAASRPTPPPARDVPANDTRTNKQIAWANVREVWKRFKRVTDELLEAEQEAKDTD